MSLMVKGRLQGDWQNEETVEGEFTRLESTFRNWITVNGAAGATGIGGFRAEPGRYHLYVSYACPWAHRTLIFRKLKKLEAIISVDVVHPFMGKAGWHFDNNAEITSDTVNGFEFMHQIYSLADHAYSGIVTVPVLWDKKQSLIVNNESSEIIRMLNSSFDQWGDKTVDMAPSELLEEIDAVNAFVYECINNGVYRTGFAKTQQAYEKAFKRLFEALDEIEIRLAKQTFLLGESITEADWRLFTTLIRFDAVYVGHFKCNLKRIADYPKMSNYLQQLYQWPGIAETVNMRHIKQHYYQSHTDLNPTGIVPLGPQQDFL